MRAVIVAILVTFTGPLSAQLVNVPAVLVEPGETAMFQVRFFAGGNASNLDFVLEYDDGIIDEGGATVHCASAIPELDSFECVLDTFRNQVRAIGVNLAGKNLSNGILATVSLPVSRTATSGKSVSSLSGNFATAATTQAFSKTWILNVAGAPAMPTGVDASDGTSAAYTRVTWNAVAGANGYQVFRCDGSGTASCGKAIAFKPDTRHDDTAGVAGRKYWYRVKACATGKCSPFSAADEGFRSEPAAAESAPPVNRLYSFDGDNKVDVALRHRTGGQWRINFMHWRIVRPNSGPAPLFTGLDWLIMGQGDFNGDKRGDFLLRNRVGNGWWVFQMNGRSRVSGALPLTNNANWVLAGIGDFNGDGNDDVLIRNTLTGRWIINFINGFAVLPNSGPTPLFSSLDWRMMGTGDFNGDGRDDVVLRNRVTGNWWIFLMTGRTVNSGGAALTTDPVWFIVGIDDFDGDGKDDILLRNRITGRWQINFMNWRIVRPNSGQTPVFANLAFAAQGTGDFNDDGRADILLRNLVTGDWWVILMNGRSINNGATTITKDLDWLTGRFDGPLP